jgi:hypothetical protein
MEAATFYEHWQLEKFANILDKQDSFYADEDHDAWKESATEKDYEPIYEKS